MKPSRHIRESINSEEDWLFVCLLLRFCVTLRTLKPLKLTLDLSSSRVGLRIGQCISSNHLCPPPRREHLPTSLTVLAGLLGWSPANFSLVFSFHCFVPEASSSLVWLFYSCSFWPHQSAHLHIYTSQVSPSF